MAGRRKRAKQSRKAGVFYVVRHRRLVAVVGHMRCTILLYGCTYIDVWNDDKKICLNTTIFCVKTEYQLLP